MTLRMLPRVAQAGNVGGRARRCQGAGWGIFMEPHGHRPLHPHSLLRRALPLLRLHDHRDAHGLRIREALSRSWRAVVESPWKDATWDGVLRGGTPSIVDPSLIDAVLPGRALRTPLRAARGFARVNPGARTREAAPAPVGRRSSRRGRFRRGPSPLPRAGHRARHPGRRARGREAGFANLSLDLIFGMPGQRPGARGLWTRPRPGPSTCPVTTSPRSPRPASGARRARAGTRSPARRSRPSCSPDRRRLGRQAPP
jgi:hypothetical protein